MSGSLEKTGMRPAEWQANKKHSSETLEEMNVVKLE